MKIVTREEFFAYMGPRDVHPRAEPERSVWIDQRTHAILGQTTPGYRNGWTSEGKAPDVYMLSDDVAPK